MPTNESRPAFRVSILAIALFQVCALFARSAFDIYLVRNGTDRAIANDLSYLVVPPILAAFLYPYLRQHARVLSDLFRFRSLTFRLSVLALLLGLSMRVTYWALLTVCVWAGVIGNGDPDAIAGPFLAFACPPLPVLALSVVTMSLLVPAVEEIVNRGFVLHALLSRGTATAVILSALMFALTHKPGTYVVAFTIGLLLAVQALNARTLWAPLVTHGSYNLAAIVDWDCFRIIWNPPVADPALDAAAAIAAPIAVAGMLLCCWLVGRQAIGARSSPTA